MKKLLIVVFVFLILISGKQDCKNFTLLDYFSGEYTVYTSNATDSNSVNLGFCYMNSKPVSDHVVGESIIIKNCEIGDAIKTLKAKVVKTESLEDGTIVIYGHTNLIDDKVQVSGNSVNIQIATKEDRTIIGWPLILGSF